VTVSRHHSPALTFLRVLRASPTIDSLTLGVHALITTVLDHPGDFGFSNITQPCHFQNATTGCSNPDACFFWDGLRPTTTAHRLIAGVIAATVVRLAAALPLLACAPRMSACMRRRAA